jgi:hypothetical protein
VIVRKDIAPINIRVAIYHRYQTYIFYDPGKGKGVIFEQNPAAIAERQAYFGAVVLAQAGW